MKDKLISQVPSHLMSKEDRHQEVAIYLRRACHRLLDKKKQAQYEGSLGDFLRQRCQKKQAG